MACAGLVATPTAAQRPKVFTPRSAQSVPLIPNVTGLTVQEAIDSLRRSAHVLGVRVADSLVIGTRSGIVVAQRPKPGSSARGVRFVQLVPAREGAIVPQLRGLTWDSAERMLAHDGFKMRETAQPLQPKTDTVSRQSPEAGTPAEVGSQVEVEFSAGQQPIATESVSVPDLYGLPIEVAADSMRHLGLDVEQLSNVKGFVLSQTPKAGAQVLRGSRARLERGVRVPALLGLMFDSAVRVLENAELLPRPLQGPDSARVRTQTPDSAAIVAPQSVVSLELVSDTLASADTVPISPGNTAQNNNSKLPIILLLIAGLALVVGAGIAVRPRSNTTKSAEVLPEVHAVAHKSEGKNEVVASDELIRSPELRFMFQPSSPQSTIITQGTLTTEKDTGDV